MGGAPLLLALAVVTVDAGWESDGRDGYRYVIQLPAEQLREIERTGQITSQLPEELRGRVSSVVIQVGNEDLPRPEVQPRSVAAESEAADTDRAETAAVGAASIYLPSPDETVRAQGDADRFSIPTMEELRQAGRQTAGEIASQAEAQLTETARQTAAQLASQAKSAIHSGIGGAADELQSRLAATDPSPASSPAANSYGTSGYRGFEETQSRAGSAPSTSASSQRDAPSTSRPPAGGTAGNSATGFAAADAPRDNRWSTGASGGSSAPAGAQAGASPTASAQPGSTQPGQPQDNRTASPTSSGAGAGSPAGSGSADAPPSATPWAFPQTGSDAQAGAGSQPNAAPAQNGSAGTPPSLAHPQNGPNSANTTAADDSSAGNRYATPPSRASEPAYADAANSANARQAMDDRRLLEEVGIDASGHAYDKRTNQLLYEDDERYPLIVDYVRRMEQAEKNRLRGRDDATARGPAAAVPSRPIYADVSPSDYGAPSARTSSPSGDPWGQWGYDGRGGMAASPNGYASPPAYNSNQPFGAYPQPGAIPPSSAQPPANWQVDPRLAQNPPAATPTSAAAPPSAAESSRPATESKQVSANESEERSRNSKSRESGITAQPLFNSMLLLSVIGNIYMGMQISRLIRRYRNLLSSQRGTAITA